ncbi:MAG: hypothetical protein AAF446_06580 [Pseudomonadota bacterium]
MKKIIVCFLASLLLAGQVLAQEYPRIDEIRDFLNGDSDLWPTFEQCASEFVDCALAAGQVSLDNRAYDDAERYFLQALEQGNHTAVLALVMLNVERHTPIETFAWSQLALAVITTQDSANETDWRSSWPFYELSRVARNFSDSEWEKGNERGQELVAKWLPVLEANDPFGGYTEANRDCPLPDLDSIERKPPRYPGAMAINRIPGWAYVIFIADRDGKVTDPISLMSSHRSFARSSVHAIEKWQLSSLRGSPECKVRRYSQAFYFSLQK